MSYYPCETAFSLVLRLAPDAIQNVRSTIPLRTGAVRSYPRHAYHRRHIALEIPRHLSLKITDGMSSASAPASARAAAVASALADASVAGAMAAAIGVRPRRAGKGVSLGRAGHVRVPFGGTGLLPYANLGGQGNSAAANIPWQGAVLRLVLPSPNPWLRPGRCRVPGGRARTWSGRPGACRTSSPAAPQTLHL